jgi:hypothetical protein
MPTGHILRHGSHRHHYTIPRCQGVRRNRASSLLTLSRPTQWRRYRHSTLQRRVRPTAQGSKGSNSLDGHCHHYRTTRTQGPRRNNASSLWTLTRLTERQHYLHSTLQRRVCPTAQRVRGSKSTKQHFNVIFVLSASRELTT